MLIKDILHIGSKIIYAYMHFSIVDCGTVTYVLLDSSELIHMDANFCCHSKTYDT